MTDQRGGVHERVEYFPRGLGRTPLEERLVLLAIVEIAVMGAMSLFALAITIAIVSGVSA